MDPTGFYLFLLGLASGIAFLTISSFRRISPPWLKWLLILLGILLISRYFTMALFTHPQATNNTWFLHHLWFVNLICFSIPSVLAIDQLLRHPAMSPKKLLYWFSPFIASYLIIIFLASRSPRLDPIAGWIPQLTSTWSLFASIVQGLFIIGFVIICLSIARKAPQKAARVSLLILAVAHIYLGIESFLVVIGNYPFRPFLSSDIFLLFAIWYAYDTGTRLQNESISL